MPITILEVHQAKVQYGNDVVLDDVSLTIEKGEFGGLIGQNGAGKTTLLRVILGLLRPNSGHVHWPNASVIGYVPQRGSLADGPVPMSVKDVVNLGSSGDTTLTKQALKQVGLPDLLNRRYSELSGGQQQRVLIAKAMATRPDVLILDEPTVGIDEASQNAFYQLLRRLQQQGMTIIMVSHDVDVVLNLVTRVICINHKVLYDGAPEHFHPDMYIPRDHAVRHHFLHHHGETHA
jgi:zinc transport system ATP-binding protein